MHHHHQENGGATLHNHSSLIDMLLHPMFSLGFSTNAAMNEPGDILGFGSSNHVFHQEEEEEEEEGEETENSETGAFKSFKSIKGGNPNSKFKKRANGVTKFCSRGHWKPSEDAKLRELVATLGPQNWNLIAEKLQGRSGKSCRLRWYNQLDPTINKRAFTEEEEERLMEAHRIYGNKWAFISRLFPGRTDNSVKNHWHVVMARRSREKSKPHMKMKLPISKQALVQENFSEHVFDSNYEHLNHGISCSIVSTSEMHCGGGTTSSPVTSAVDQYGDAAYYTERTEAPPFIDFLGVGS